MTELKEQIIKPEAGVYACESCQENPGDACDDYCALNHVDELPATWSDYWPSCKCCGAEMHLVRPLFAA